jgi:predicted glycoside hydrolase/deacetylase ChbG (UPF0249 family)
MKILFYFFLLLLLSGSTIAQQVTYAEKLGFEKGIKVIILHVDDLGMSYSSNKGALLAINDGLANSGSIMMPCPWVPGIVNYMKKHPGYDFGLHLTFTSEWDDYRWGPVAGVNCVPTLADEQGKLWDNVALVLKNTSNEDFETEMRAQIDLAIRMGINPTHLDSHMGTIFAKPEFIKIYVKLGIEYGIPILFPGGHNTIVSKDFKDNPDFMDQARQIGKQVWDAGMPVIDDVISDTYGWTLPEDMKKNDENLQAYKTSKFIERFNEMQPGITEVILHCTVPSDIFKDITTSGETRKGDLLAMLDPKLKEYIEKEGIVLTTWKELSERRDKIKD